MNHRQIWEMIKADQEPQLVCEEPLFSAELVVQSRKMRHTKSHIFNKPICQQKQVSRAPMPRTTMKETMLLEANSDEASTQTRG